jgi:transcriptional regulator of acetoin/glycerol metabolism
LLAYNWPGNVRELRNLLESILIHTSSAEISPDEFPASLKEQCEELFAVGGDERRRLVSALASTNWNKSKAAGKLRWSRMTLYRKMAKYQVAGSKSH